MTQQSPLRVGLIGTGRIGQVHANTITRHVADAVLVAVADVNAEAARRCADEYRVPWFSDDPHRLIERSDVEAVLICSPTDTHADLIVAAARAGKHVFCEKPIALDLPQTDRALQAARAAGVVLQIGFNRRFDPNHQRVKQAIENGEVGEPHLLHIISRDPAPPPIGYVRSSGGIFLDMAIHDFDMARFLIGAEVEEVFSWAGVRVDPAIGEAGDVDTAITMLRFANGVIGTVDNSRRAVYGYDQRVEVFGSGGAIQTLNQYPNQAVLSDARAVRRDLPLHFFMQRYIESYRVEIEAFIHATRGLRPVPVTGEDARYALLIGLAARRSWQTGRPVRLEEVLA